MRLHKFNTILVIFATDSGPCCYITTLFIVAYYYLQILRMSVRFWKLTIYLSRSSYIYSLKNIFLCKDRYFLNSNVLYIEHSTILMLQLYNKNRAEILIFIFDAKEKWILIFLNISIGYTEPFNGSQFKYWVYTSTSYNEK